MKIRCLFGHDWRALPWFKPLDDDPFTNPTKICMRCFKTWRQRYVLVVRSVEGRGWQYYLPPHWEGQSPPEGYVSWTEFRERMEQAKKNLIRKAK